MYLDNQNLITITREKNILQESEYFVDDFRENNYLIKSRKESEKIADDENKKNIFITKKDEKDKFDLNLNFLIGILFGFFFGLLTVFFILFCQKKMFIIGLIIGLILDFLVNIYSLTY